MITLFLPVLVMSTVCVGTLIALHAILTRLDSLQSATVQPYSSEDVPACSSDTVAMATASTAFLPASDWQTLTVHQLSNVTDLLDYLENLGVNCREVITLNNDHFVVRWK